MILEPIIRPYYFFNSASRVADDGFYMTESKDGDPANERYKVCYWRFGQILWLFEVFGAKYSPEFFDCPTYQISAGVDYDMGLVKQDELFDFIKEETPQCMPWILFHFDELGL